jgi:LEA14-like dessication related protein
LKLVIRISSIVFLLVAMSACSTLYQQLDPPKISVESFRTLPSGQGTPRFEIKLRVVNPNVVPLDIAGVSYSVEIMDRELITGVANDVPVIEAYGDEVVTLEAGLQLFELLRLLASLGTAPGDAVPYRLSAKMDFRGMVPTQRIEDSGEIRLN